MNDRELVAQIREAVNDAMRPLANTLVDMAASVASHGRRIAVIEDRLSRHSTRVRAQSESLHEIEVDVDQQKTAMQRLEAFATPGRRLIAQFVTIIFVAAELVDRIVFRH